MRSLRKAPQPRRRSQNRVRDLLKPGGAPLIAVMSRRRWRPQLSDLPDHNPEREPRDRSLGQPRQHQLREPGPVDPAAEQRRQKALAKPWSVGV